MKRHTVDSIMTRDVVSVRPNASLKEIAARLAEHDISAVPVTDYGDRVVGVVSEADLVARQGGPARRRSRWHRVHLRPARQPAATATDLMTTPAITIGEGTEIIDVARLLVARDIKRVPVVDAENRLLGIVSRHDLVRVFVRPDDEIAKEVREEVLLHDLWIDPAGVQVTVLDGVVTLRGQVERRSLVPIVASLCHRVDGVVDVTNELTFAMDDTEVDDGTAPQNVGILHGPGQQH
jgi:CBS-domain-containing membrane protein